VTRWKNRRDCKYFYKKSLTDPRRPFPLALFFSLFSFHFAKPSYITLLHFLLRVYRRQGRGGTVEIRMLSASLVDWSFFLSLLWLSLYLFTVVHGLIDWLPSWGSRKGKKASNTKRRKGKERRGKEFRGKLLLNYPQIIGLVHVTWARGTEGLNFLCEFSMPVRSPSVRKSLWACQEKKKSGIGFSSIHTTRCIEGPATRVTRSSSFRPRKQCCVVKHSEGLFHSEACGPPHSPPLLFNPLIIPTFYCNTSTATTTYYHIYLTPPTPSSLST